MNNVEDICLEENILFVNDLCDGIKKDNNFLIILSNFGNCINVMKSFNGKMFIYYGFLFWIYLIVIEWY